MVTGLVKRNRELEREVEELQAGQESLQQRASTLESELKNSELKREYLEFQLEKFRRMLFGRSSEKLPARGDGSLQLELFEEAKREIENEERTELEAISYERKKRQGKRRPIPEDIHRERIEVDVDPELRVCPDCGEDMQCIGHDVSEDLEYIPALLYIIEHLKKKYACKKCQSGVVQAKRPPRPLPKVKAAAGLLAYVLVAKYQDHLPLHRQERIFARHSMALSRKTLGDWVQKLADLLRPIVEAMKQDLLNALLLQADETPVKVNNAGKSQAYIWSYGIPDKEVVYDFTLGRSSDGPESFFAEKFPPHLQSDSYSVYVSLDRRKKSVHVGCWAHARRRFFEARDEDPRFAKLILPAIQKLFRIERVAKEKGIAGEKLVALRRSESLPTLEAIKLLIDAKKPEALPESGVGEAIGYALNNWTALTRYVEIAEAPLSNNSAERSLRGVVVGKKNWLFIGHPNAGPRAAVILSLIETCRRLGVEPYHYLKSVIAELAKDPAQAANLTPRKWLERERAATENVTPGSAR